MTWPARASWANRTIYVYALVDPRTEEVRYVGQTVNPADRLEWHVSDAIKAQAGDGKRWNWHKVNWLRQLVGFRPWLIILQVTQGAAEAGQAERTWIALYRRIGVRLTNITDGGDRVLRQRQYVRHERCETPGCQAPDGDVARVDPRPMCNACSRLFKKYGEPEYLEHKRKPRQTQCAVEGCTRPYRKGKYCSMHGGRIARYGDVGSPNSRVSDEWLEKLRANGSKGYAVGRQRQLERRT